LSDPKGLIQHAATTRECGHQGNALARFGPVTGQGGPDGNASVLVTTHQDKGAETTAATPAKDSQGTAAADRCPQP
jgi:hypothetical protein